MRYLFESALSFAPGRMFSGSGFRSSALGVILEPARTTIMTERGIGPFEAIRVPDFELDQDTGAITMVFYSRVYQPRVETFNLDIVVVLKPKIARALLRDLPELQKILEEAAKLGSVQ
jgi:hypothetical protein